MSHATEGAQPKISELLTCHEELSISRPKHVFEDFCSGNPTNTSMRSSTINKTNISKYHPINAIIDYLAWGKKWLRTEFWANYTSFTRLDCQKHRYTPQDASRSFPRAFWSSSPFLQGLILMFGATNHFSEICNVAQNWGQK